MVQGVKRNRNGLIRYVSDYCEIKVFPTDTTYDYSYNPMKSYIIRLNIQKIGCPVEIFDRNEKYNLMTSNPFIKEDAFELYNSNIGDTTHSL